MPLERKVPMIPGPKDAYNLTRCKVGKRLWTIDGPKLDFDLTDPYHRETYFPYEALHDRHLLAFFNRPNNMRYLLKAGFITEDMGVKCSLYEYNAYRQYLRKIQADRIAKELRERDRLLAERRILRNAEEQARQQVHRYRFLLCMERFISFSSRTRIERYRILRIRSTRNLFFSNERTLIERIVCAYCAFMFLLLFYFSLSFLPHDRVSPRSSLIAMIIFDVFPIYFMDGYFSLVNCV